MVRYARLIAHLAVNICAGAMAGAVVGWHCWRVQEDRRRGQADEERA